MVLLVLFQNIEQKLVGIVFSSHYFVRYADVTFGFQPFQTLFHFTYVHFAARRHAECFEIIDQIDDGVYFGGVWQTAGHDVGQVDTLHLQKLHRVKNFLKKVLEFLQTWALNCLTASSTASSGLMSKSSMFSLTTLSKVSWVITRTIFQTTI